MATGTCPSCRKIIAWTGVLGIHAALVVLFLRTGSHRAAAPNPDLESPLVLILLERPAPEHVPAPPVPFTGRVPSPSRPRKAPRPAEVPVSPPTEPSLPRPPSVDWYREAEQEGARHALATAPGSQGRRQPGTVDIAAPVCETRPQAHWEPQPQRFGLIGGLIPYVRLGPCAIGVGLFGCAFGQPEASGRVLDAAREHGSDALDGPSCAP